jgi:Predicted integral membrane protein (DUF2269)
MVLAAFGDTGYKLALFLHVVAVVVAFGTTFGYGIFFSVVPQYPKSAPAILTGIQKADRYLVDPGMLVVLAAGIYLMVSGNKVWDGSDAFIVVGWIAILVLFGLQHGFFRPQVKKVKALAERDLEAGDTLSPEFEATGQLIGRVGTLAGLIIVVTVFFMTYKPFM